MKTTLLLIMYYCSFLPKSNRLLRSLISDSNLSARRRPSSSNHFDIDLKGKRKPLIIDISYLLIPQIKMFFILVTFSKNKFSSRLKKYFCLHSLTHKKVLYPKTIIVWNICSNSKVLLNTIWVLKFHLLVQIFFLCILCLAICALNRQIKFVIKSLKRCCDFPSVCWVLKMIDFICWKPSNSYLLQIYTNQKLNPINWLIKVQINFNSFNTLDRS